MATERTTVSVVIPNWNGLKFLKMVLPSLKKQTHRNFETIVVDNGSTDESVEYIKKHHPDVRIIALPKNLGFPAACNRGMEAAETEFVALINNDLELDRKWIEVMEDALRRYPKAGSAACKMLQYKDRKKIDETGGMASWYGIFYPRGRDETDRGQYDSEEPVFHASGGAVLYRTSALDEVGLLDESFFAYLEDVDLGFRLQLAGWSCVYIPTAVVYHVGGGTNIGISGFRQRLWAKNTRLLVLKDYPFTALVRYAPKLCIAEAKMLVSAFKDGWLGIYTQAWLGFWGGLPGALRHRWWIQRRRKASLRELNAVISRRFPSLKKAS